MKVYQGLKSYSTAKELTMAEQKFDFWNDHSLEFLEMAMSRDYLERVENPDGYGIRTGECGDTVEFFLAEKDGRISSVSYDVDGCVNTHEIGRAHV